MTNKRIFYGAKTLIMINSGTVDFLKLDLTLPLHLNAENNIGKTSTVNTLQFLYIDSMDDMYLPSTPSESTNFYFGDEFSYLVFECLSKSGSYCVVLNRRRDSRKHYSRFVIKASYCDDFFIDPENGKVRSWEDVLEFLDMKKLESFTVANRHWWRVLSGLTDRKNAKALPALFILPVKDEPSYSRFKTIYRNLLSMSSIKLETFKDILLSCAVAAGEKRKIDFAEKDYKLRFDKAKALQMQHEFFVHNENLIKRLIEKDNDLRIFRKKIPFLFANINNSFNYYNKFLALRIDEIRERLERIKGEFVKLSSERDSKIGELSRIALENEQAENFLDEFDRLKNDTELLFYRDSYSFDDLLYHKENDLDRRFYILNENLKDVASYDKHDLNERIQMQKSEIETYQKILASSGLFASFLVKNGISKKEINKLAQLFRYELLVTDMHAVNIHKKSLLVEKIKEITASVSDNHYSDKCLDINLPQPYAVDIFSDTEQIKKKLTFLNSTLKELEQKLAIFMAKEDKLLELDDIREKRIHVSEILKLYEKFNQMSEKSPFVEKSILKLSETRIILEESLKFIESNLTELKEEEHFLFEENKDVSDSLRSIRSEFSRLSETVLQHFPNLLSEDGKEGEKKYEIDFLKEEIPNFTHKIESISADMQFVRMKKAEILEKAGLFYDRESDWKNFIDANSDISSAAERVDKEWQTFFALAKHDFRTLVHCVDSVSALLKTIDRTFNKQRISNLAAIKISVVYQDIYQEAREFTLDSDDLFADSSKRRIYFGMFQKYFSNKYSDLRAEDMFHIKIEISNPNNPAENKNITSFENESEGTNYTIKALLLSQLLKEQFKYGLYQENIIFHYYLDEIGQLDETNLSNIVQQNLEKHLLPITAAPRPVVDPLCHPECRVVTLKEHLVSKRTFVASENTFKALKSD